MLKDRLITKASYKKAIESPLLNANAIIRAAVDSYMSRYAKDIVSRMIDLVKTEAILDKITPKKGIHYRDGIDGKDGLNGKDGAKGDKGDPGVSPDAEDVAAIVLTKLPKAPELAPNAIVSKINAAENKITLSQIDGLLDKLEELKRAFLKPSKKSSGGGGGMGDVQHEVKSVSSATTTVTTSFKIAGNGYAIWLYYNGQLLSRGVQYTVGTDLKTITFTFTLDDDSTVDIIYHR